MSNAKNTDGPACGIEIERFAEAMLSRYADHTVAERLEGCAASIRRRLERAALETRHDRWRQNGIDPNHQQEESAFKTGLSEGAKPPTSLQITYPVKRANGKTNGHNGHHNGTNGSAK